MKTAIGRVLRGVVIATVAASIAGGAAAAPAPAAASDCPGRGVPVSKISIQLWTFADYVGFGSDPATQARLETVFAALSDMGYRNVEPFTFNGLTAEQYRALLEKYDLPGTRRSRTRGRWACATSARERRRRTSRPSSSGSTTRRCSTGSASVRSGRGWS
jgi:hypothetical protein